MVILKKHLLSDPIQKWDQNDNIQLKIDTIITGLKGNYLTRFKINFDLSIDAMQV
ncbi:hypothetical protein L950_0212430 [Sphingobacterium sp. IITKGP-BTPF85]|nr:hypothetical protein L950_0212430 [Sphingobacterium sp. IITKGP-BTPF85]